MIVVVTRETSKEIISIKPMIFVGPATQLPQPMQGKLAFFQKGEAFSSARSFVSVATVCLPNATVEKGNLNEKSTNEKKFRNSFSVAETSHCPHCGHSPASPPK